LSCCSDRGYVIRRLAVPSRWDTKGIR